MTREGVAYSHADTTGPVRYIQNWPGRRGANEDKVPTTLVYDGERLSSWGFLCETRDEQYGDGKKLREWFKTLLNLERLEEYQEEDPEHAPQSMAEVRAWVTDYMVKLYQQIERTLKPKLANDNWEEARIEFLFSVPSTWKPYPTIEDFKEIIERSGFRKGKNHSIVVGLTEAEAAAVYTSRDRGMKFKEGDVLLICDAGGGTTDISLLQVVATAGQALTLKQLDVVFGANIGSSAIDAAFYTFAFNLLKAANATLELPAPPEELAWQMSKSRDFQNMKCEFGAPDTDFPTISIPVPRLGKEYVNSAVGISDGKLKIARYEWHNQLEPSA